MTWTNDDEISCRTLEWWSVSSMTGRFVFPKVFGCRTGVAMFRIGMICHCQGSSSFGKCSRKISRRMWCQNLVVRISFGSTSSSSAPDTAKPRRVRNRLLVSVRIGTASTRRKFLNCPSSRTKYLASTKSENSSWSSWSSCRDLMCLLIMQGYRSWVLPRTAGQAMVSCMMYVEKSFPQNFCPLPGGKWTKLTTRNGSRRLWLGFPMQRAEAPEAFLITTSASRTKPLKNLLLWKKCFICC